MCLTIFSFWKINRFARIFVRKLKYSSRVWEDNLCDDSRMDLKM